MPTFPTLDFMQINARYPKAVKKITEWVFNQPELKSATDGFIDPTNPEGSKEQFVGLMIQMDPRKLYDIFDQFEIYVSVFKDADSFWYAVNMEDPINAYGAKNRHQAEQTAFSDAFEILEKQS
jgi:hypothetical protein